MAVDIPELDAGTPFILRKRWFPMVITSPATLYIVLLNAASHYAAITHTHNDPKIQRILLDLRHAALAAINVLIRSVPPNGHMPDTVIGAVAKMASYESMFGSGTLYRTHMRGLQHMVNQRGGLTKLGLDGLLGRMVQWIDINSAFILGEHTFFTPSQPLAGHTGWDEVGTAVQPNPVAFLAVFGIY